MLSGLFSPGSLKSLITGRARNLIPGIANGDTSLLRRRLYT